MYTNCDRHKNTLPASHFQAVFAAQLWKVQPVSNCQLFWDLPQWQRASSPGVLLSDTGLHLMPERDHWVELRMSLKKQHSLQRSIMITFLSYMLIPNKQPTFHLIICFQKIQPIVRLLSVPSTQHAPMT